VILAAFRARFPEFESAGDTFAQAVLDEAATELDATEIGDAYDAAHGLLAAHKMAISPFGVAARMLNDEGKSTYEGEFSAVLARAIPCIFSV
jgi:hypothetical protein